MDVYKLTNDLLEANKDLQAQLHEAKEWIGRLTRKVTDLEAVIEEQGDELVDYYEVVQWLEGKQDEALEKLAEADAGRIYWAARYRRAMARWGEQWESFTTEESALELARKVALMSAEEAYHILTVEGSFDNNDGNV